MSLLWIVENSWKYFSIESMESLESTHWIVPEEAPIDAWVSLSSPTVGRDGRTCVFVPQVRISSISRISKDCSIRQLQATGLSYSLSFFFLSFFLCPSLWSIHLDVFHKVTNDSMPLAFFFHPVLSSCLERDLLSWQPCGFSCIRTWGCCTMHGTTPGPLCNTDDSFSFLFFFFSFNCQSSFSHTLAMSLFLLVCEDLSDLNSFANSQWLSVFRIVGGDGKHRFTPDFLLIRLLSSSRLFVFLFLFLCSSLGPDRDYPGVWFLFGFSVPFFDLHTSIFIFECMYMTRIGLIV